MRPRRLKSALILSHMHYSLSGTVVSCQQRMAPHYMGLAAQADLKAIPLFERGSAHLALKRRSLQGKLSTE